MTLDQNGNPAILIDRSRDRYFVTDDEGIERETDAKGFIAMERQCGFRPKPGHDFATGGFSQGRREGRIEFWFDGAAEVFDGQTGDVQIFDGCAEAYEHARAANTGPRRRYYAQRART